MPHLEKKLVAEFLDSGELVSLMHEDIMINQLYSTPLDGSVTQVYLRIKDQQPYTIIPLIGTTAASQFSKSEQAFYWTGEAQGITYQVRFALGEKDTWFWTVDLTGEGQVIDVILGQDIGNAAKGAVRSNEAYMSQYVDHFVTKNQDQISITSRQNQPQNDQFPVVEIGGITPIVGFETDGYQFFGKAYEETNEPISLQKEVLDSKVYQYEFAYIALQSIEYTLTDTTTTCVFYGAFATDHPEAVTKPLYEPHAIKEIYAHLEDAPITTTFSHPVSYIGRPIVGRRLTTEEIDHRFPVKVKEEYLEDGEIGAFFTKNERHVVLKNKELAMERATGHILLSGIDLDVDHPVMSTTTYMYGLFNSQIVLGNTSMNKLMSNSRNSLNRLKHAGQRIYLKEADMWRMLTLPSAFEMGLNSATWYYQLADDCLKITTFTACENHQIKTVIESEAGKSYTFAITNHILMDAAEESPTYRLEQVEQQLTIKPSETSVITTKYPDLTYQITLDQSFTLTDETILVEGIAQTEQLVFVVQETNELTIDITGSLDGVTKTRELEFKVEEEAIVAKINELLNRFELFHDTVDVTSMNLLTRWYVLDMLIHYLSPHGLEQYGGAAWGTRDVSQGPTEFFLATNRLKVVASIITHIFENQFEDDGNWPQWFMFDRYEEQKADESHGDVIVWPMKVVADYLEKSGDFSILDKQISYTDRETFKKTQHSASLFEHLQKEIQYIEENFLPGTSLSCYGDGDWDDTLQPYDSRLKKYMASSWTVALTYQVTKKLGALLKDYRPEASHQLTTLSEQILADFNTYMLKDETIPGFVYMENQDEVEYMIHPTDQKTGIHYRLLPMTRSMIAEILTPEQVKTHLSTIKEHLYFPDGVRLMNRPAHYQGGVSHNFKRAEQAANFGREIGLQYVHAHIRFTEAMAKIGEANETWKGLNTINPIDLQKRVPNAALRQSNAYFSSSDGAFATRYDAQEHFDQLKTGEVAVKGGWRVYSSGPGIYLNQLITNVLGIRVFFDHYVFDPVLPEELDGLRLNYRIADKDVTFVYHLGSKESKVVIDQHVITTSREANPYRLGGFAIPVQTIEETIKNQSIIEIYC
ncbi:GH36-type glycosyl hydrolase domain-containing protein [uncultured Enterococcus sp.]|uniref:GH36-type glycosyl hydrolase domain-containing protein n=1 Tax=uncultured Enterococcus sp. TaxID=167972 RepID=UPI0025DEBEE1|nr:cellobiose phosphorylase [uncultured Enterococcus sp.]